MFAELMIRMFGMKTPFLPPDDVNQDIYGNHQYKDWRHEKAGNPSQLPCKSKGRGKTVNAYNKCKDDHPAGQKRK
jgi:hypothetical protein